LESFPREGDTRKNEKVKYLKKPFSRVLLVLIGGIAGIVISGAVFSATGFSVFGHIREKPPSSDDVDNAALTALAFSVLELIRDGDFVALSRIAHPEFGVVFSPSPTVALSTDRRFSVEQIAALGGDNNVYVWGICNGSGEPIDMTPYEYFSEFVLAKDYSDAPIVGINRVVKSGNALENITDVFPDVQFIEFHMPGGGKDTADELGWSSLRLGFEKYDGRLWLTLILHSKWTV